MVQACYLRHWQHLLLCRSYAATTLAMFPFDIMFLHNVIAFSIATVETWNDLPLDIRMAKTVDMFFSKLKTHFFQIVYG